MDYSLYFETLERTALQQVDTWAKVVGIIFMLIFLVSGITGIVNQMVVCTLYGRHGDSKYYKFTFIMLIISFSFLMLLFIFMTVAPTHDSGEYAYETTITENFDLVTFETDERFTDIEYSNGKLTFKSYEYIEEVEY